MKCTIPEISWHNREPVLSVDFQYGPGQMQRLATGGSDCHVLIWLLQVEDKGTVQWEFVSDLVRHNRAVNIVRFSPNGEMLASGDDEAAIWLWKHLEKEAPDIFSDEDQKENKEHWAPFRALRSHIEDVYDLSWSANSNFLISGSVDNSAILWDIQKGRNVGILSDHKGFVQGVAWDPKNQYVATQSSDRAVRVYNINTKRVVHKIHKFTQPTSGDQPAKPVRMFHDDTLKSFCRRLSFTPDGELLIAPAGLLELEEGKPVNATFVFARNAFNRPALYLPTKDKYTIAVRCCPVMFELRPIANETEPSSSDTNNKQAPYFTVFNLPYRVVFAVATQSSILFYDTQQPTPFGHVSNIHYTRLTDLAWSKDGRILVVSSTDGYCSFVTFAEDELGILYRKKENDTNADITTAETPVPSKVLPKTSEVKVSSQLTDDVKKSPTPLLVRKELKWPKVELPVATDTCEEIPDKLSNVKSVAESEETSDLKLVLELTNDSIMPDVKPRVIDATEKQQPTPGGDCTVSEVKPLILDGIEKVQPTSSVGCLQKELNASPCTPTSPAVNSGSATKSKTPRRIQFITLSSPKNKKVPSQVTSFP